jgi:hypothetical protein
VNLYEAWDVDVDTTSGQFLLLTAMYTNTHAARTRTGTHEASRRCCLQGSGCARLLMRSDANLLLND